VASLTFVVLLTVLLTSAAILYVEGGPHDAPRLSAAPAEPGIIAGRASVIDGDTLEIHGQRIRLHGIDAPESNQTCRDGDGRDYRCGERATRALSAKIGLQAISCEARDIDRYNRVVAVCSAAGEDVNAWLAAEGWAVAYRRYSRDYVGAEEAARSAQRGMWAGTFDSPEDWRHGDIRVAADSAPPPPASCVVKGNISRDGERIYHLPGDRYYAATRIDPPKGERMFCTEAEARAAGWRRSKR
jgi:endonuclease YncB( thermonuclease family)